MWVVKNAESESSTTDNTEISSDSFISIKAVF